MHLLLLPIAALLFLVVYFIPTMVARSRNHINATAIFVANIFLGFTILGWALTLVWAFTVSPGYVAPQKSDSNKGFLKFVLIAIAVLFVLLVFIGFGGMIAQRTGQVGSVSAPTTTASAPAVQTGVPAPADEILGK